MVPTNAFLLLVCGILCIYSESVWPGRVIPGLVGGVLAISGTYFLWRNSPTAIGLLLIGGAVIFFVAEAFWRVDLVSGVAGLVALTCGFCLLFPAPQGIAVRLAIPVCVIFGAITIFLMYQAKRARRNKRSDL